MTCSTMRLVVCLIATAGVAAIASGQPYQIPSDTDYYATRAQAGEGTWTVVRGGELGPPQWQWENDVKSLLRVPNRAQPEPWFKKVYLLLVYDTAHWNEHQIPGDALANMQIVDPAQGVTLDFHDVSLGTGQAYWEWTIRPQPAYEVLKFPGWHGYDMHNSMIRMEVGTKCIPQPGAACLLALSSILLAQRRRR